MIKAVLFDLDGVLTETSEQHYLAWKSLSEDLGIEIDLKFNEDLKGISRMESLEKILIHGGKENIFNHEEKIKLATMKNNIYNSMIKEFNKFNLFDGVKELLDKLKERNIKIVLTSASKNGPNLLELLEIKDYFDFIVDPSSVDNGKPAPDIFLKGAELVGVNPNECIGIEDSVAGIQAIKDAEMYAVGIGDKENLKRADIVFKEVKNIEIEKILKTLE